MTRPTDPRLALAPAPGDPRVGSGSSSRWSSQMSRSSPRGRPRGARARERSPEGVRGVRGRGRAARTRSCSVSTPTSSSTGGCSASLPTGPRPRSGFALLSGREHEVLSGVCLIGPRAAGIPGAPLRERSGVSRSAVTFRELDEPTHRGLSRVRGVAGEGWRVCDPGARVDPDRKGRGGLLERGRTAHPVLLELDPALASQ